MTIPKRKNFKIRWMLVLYDFLIFSFVTYTFLWRYRGGGILSLDQVAVHAGLSFLCVAVPRFLGGTYKQIWRYGGVESYMHLIFWDTVGAAIYFVLDHAHIPGVVCIATSRIVSIMGINMLMALSLRMLYRYFFKHATYDTKIGRMMIFFLNFLGGSHIISQRDAMRHRKKIAIIGAGRVGVALAENLLNNPESGYLPVCFIDTLNYKIGREIVGLPVLDENHLTVDKMNELDLDEIVIAIPTMSAQEKKDLYDKMKPYGFDIKIYDYPVMEKAGGRLQLRNFEIEDVLFRKQITMEEDLTTEYYKDSTILVTGGGGSIGSELSRQVAAMKPRKLILLDVYENGVYDVQQELRMKYGTDLDLQLEILSITDRPALEQVFRAYRPDIVIHAAAHKHVPLMEHNCVEAVRNNVFGTLNVIQLAEEYGAKRFMALSTDKAVNPTNVMGATKRMCEFIMQAYSTKGTLRCSATRFGNVLGSAGSVIPLFKRQIASGGPITLTDKRIIRYFMTIPEASQLVLQSGAMARNGELFVLDMGQPVRILELAENMIRLSGLVPYKDIDIVETGLRPGEKLYEELLVKSEELDKTDNDLIFIERDAPISMEELQQKLDVLDQACDTMDNCIVKEALRSVVPTFYRPEEINKNV
ncbi:MAG: nucleoside-diphosphate sugar epimerase/dehydratase [Lachnospiraceae bacterium]|nr:nucleoside-diphosphate sugar epimerase/dehydratase [Lachnospiraceae bacterium]